MHTVNIRVAVPSDISGGVVAEALAHGYLIADVVGVVELVRDDDNQLVPATKVHTRVPKIQWAGEEIG